MIVRNANVSLHDEVVKSREDRKKEYEDAMKANEKEAKEIQKGHGETGKKVSNPVLKAMHLSESMFEDDRNKYDKFKSDVYNALSEVIFNYSWDGISKNDIEYAIEWFLNHFYDTDESEYVEESIEKPKRYSDGKTGKWWYFTTHGVQPGSVPKDLNVLEVKDTPNGTYFALDGILNTSELKEYDIKEKTPSVDEALTLNEGKWNLTLNNSSELRAAIDDEDYTEVINQIRLAYNQMLDEGIIDEDDYESWTEDFDLYGDFSDWDDPEGTVNYELSNFYDACDNLNVWVAI